MQPEVLGRRAPHRPGALELPPGAAPLPPTRTRNRRHDDRRAVGRTVVADPAILWGIIAASIGLLWWLFFHRHPRWTTWFIGAVPFLVALFVCYMYLERLLPSNY